MSKRIKDGTSLPELTIRGCILGTVITILFCSSNVYLGLKVGLTFASSIPAAIISMALLSFFKKANILENTMVQSFGSAAGTISAIIFILPAMIMLNIWHGFPYWETFTLCAVGGVFGVLFSVPLRRSLVVKSNLPYPEGTAAAEILHLGTTKSRAGLVALSIGAILSAGFALISNGFKFIATSFSYFFRAGSAVFGISATYSMSLLGAGYLVGIRLAIPIIIGVILGWVVVIPIVASSMANLAHLSPVDFAHQIWLKDVRMIGVGALGIGAVWTLIVILQPIIYGLTNAAKHSHDENSTELSKIKKLRTEHDLSTKFVVIVSLILIIPLMVLIYNFVASTIANNSYLIIKLTVIACILSLMIGILVSAASGYMAGLLGSSVSPISGIGIIAIIIAALIMLFVVQPGVATNHHVLSTNEVNLLRIGLAIFITAIVIAIACVANDNLQDLKTGQLIGATPWKQQMALIFGVIVGSLIIPIVMNLLYHAYGFAGAMPRPNMNLHNSLAAPQAMIMAALAKGIISKHMHWEMIGLGSGLAILFILFDEIYLKRWTNYRLPVLGIGMGLYLPLSACITVIIGGLLSYFVKRKNKSANNETDFSGQKGILFASGLIVGEAVLGIINAGLIVATGNEDILTMVSQNFAPIANYLGISCFLLAITMIYMYLIKE